MPSSTTTFLALLTLLPLTLAKTDLSGCTSTTSGPSIIYFVPGTGELCSFLDCGGGRAPPKTTVPGCPQYDGTATYSPSFLPGFGAAETGVLSSVTSFVGGPITTTSSAAGSMSTSKVVESTSVSAGGEVVTLSGTRSLSASSSSSSEASESESGLSSSSTPTSSGTGTGAGISTTSSGSNSTGSPASQTTSSGSSSRSGSASGTGTSTGTAAGALNTGNAGAVNAVSGVVSAVAAVIAFFL